MEIYSTSVISALFQTSPNIPSTSLPFNRLLLGAAETATATGTGAVDGALGWSGRAARQSTMNRFFTVKDCQTEVMDSHGTSDDLKDSNDIRKG